MIIWILGKSGSGKTSLAKALLRTKYFKNKSWIHIDGDAIRKIFKDEKNFSISNRRNNASRISKLVKLLSRNDNNIIISSLTNFRYWLNWNRKNLKNYFEIYLEVSLDKLIKRDIKKIYAKALSKKLKNVVGVDIKFNIPHNPDLKINNDNNDKKLANVLKIVFKNKKFLKMLKNAK
jgi:cytidine diphosphoramidate kinase